jgi:hypothetical protein
VKSVKLVCDNEAAVKVCTRKRTQSLFHRTEGDHDLVSAIQYLQDTWCQDLDIKYEWVKGHLDDLDREPTKCERLNIVADKICDTVRASAQGPYGAKPNCGMWPNERCALFIRGIKITSNWKERITQQLLDGDLQEYLMEKQQWTTHSFQNICCKRHETALKQISKARQAQTAKMCHNLRYTGARHVQRYGEVKHCCMCGDNEDRRHVITCKSLYAELIREDSWSKPRKVMEKWGISQDMWITIENGVHHYTMNPKKRDHNNIPTEPSPPFGPTFYVPRNRLKVAFRAQS